MSINSINVNTLHSRIEASRSRVLKILGFIRHDCVKHIDKLLLYGTVVCSILEYASVL